MPVNRLKKKKDGTLAYKDDCQGVEAMGGDCNGDVALATKRANSFGLPFITHAYLCDAHSEKGGFKK